MEQVLKRFKSPFLKDAIIQARDGKPLQMFALSPMEPDILFIIAQNGKRIIYIVDAKASRLPKVSHHVQVALYAMALEQIINDLQLKHVIIANTGIIWLPPTKMGAPDRAEPFSLKLLIPSVADFLFGSGAGSKPLLQLLRPGARNEAHFNWQELRGCLDCGNKESCKSEAKQKGIPSLSL